MSHEILDVLLPLLANHPELADVRRDGDDIRIGVTIVTDAPPDGPFLRPGDPIPDAGPIARVVDGTTIRMGKTV